VSPILSPHVPRGGKREPWRDKKCNLEEKLTRQQDDQFVHQDMQGVPEEIIERQIPRRKRYGIRK
jgi:hypothetical protein